ncbi:MAG: hypothetical protein ACFFD4_21050 [Candidatus Odinarchaeota archaeon]
MAVALADGTITGEEQALLGKIMDSILEYSLVIEEALGAGMITIEEEKEFLRAYNKISKDAHELALQDAEISNDEMAILTKLTQLVRELRKDI